MASVFEIAAAVLAVFGAYMLLDMLRVRLVYPRCVRERVCGAVIIRGGDSVSDAAMYAAYLRREKKISPKRLIILADNDIIVDDSIARCGDVYRYYKCKETADDARNTKPGEES